MMVTSAFLAPATARTTALALWDQVDGHCSRQEREKGGVP